METVFQTTDYIRYLNTQLGAKGTRSGRRKKAADSLGVHSTYISQVLRGKADLSLEQAERMNEFLAHTKEEGEYFLLLVMKARAGTRELRQRFQEKIQDMIAQRNLIRERIKQTSSISTQDQEQFYSSYLYGAIHTLTSIPQFRTVPAIAEALKIPVSRVQEVVTFLLRLGVLTTESSKLLPGSQHIHLRGDSRLIYRHHSNWRLHAMNAMERASQKDLHYSSVVSLSKQDIEKIKDSLVSNLKENLDVIRSSPEEEAYVYSFDFYPLVDH